MPNKTWDELLNDADTEGGGFEPLPAANYDLVVVKATAGVTKEHSRPKYDLQCKVVTGPYTNRVVFHTFTIVQENPKALAFFFRHMAVFGLTRAEFFSKNPTDDQVAEALLGKVFTGLVAIKPPYKEGADPQNRIDKFFTASDAAVLAARNIPLEGSASAAPSSPSVPTAGVPSAGVPSAGVPSAPAQAAPGVPAAPAPQPVAAAPVAPPAPPAPPAAPVATNTDIPLPPPPPQHSF